MNINSPAGEALKRKNRGPKGHGFCIIVVCVLSINNLRWSPATAPMPSATAHH
jgi:hypothetical protein